MQILIQQAGLAAEHVFVSTLQPRGHTGQQSTAASLGTHTGESQGSRKVNRLSYNKCVGDTYK